MCPLTPLKIDMCTSPNYVGYVGLSKYSLSKLDVIPKYEFLGKKKYEDMINATYPWIQVPCGQCLECRIQQSRLWADRLILESKNYKNNYFITLTYDDDHIGQPSLNPDDFTKFMKRLRKHFKDVTIKYFMCGEYGDSSLRKHFHAIIYNLPLNDLTLDFRQYDNATGRLVLKHRFDNSDGLMYSPIIHKLWNYQGDISVGKVEYHSCQYVAGYVTKKYNKDAQQKYKELGLLPEYARMSRRPGLSSKFFDDNGDWLLFQGDMIIPSPGNAHISVTPRYYDKLFIKKYGQDIFDYHIRYNRLLLRSNKRNTNIHENINLDNSNFHRDYKLKKKQLLRDKI